jgi:aspartate-semialdehyde dehydrogenase
LFNQTRHIFMNQVPQADVLPKRIAFNLIPQIDVFMDDRSTREEWKMVVETKKILDPNIEVAANCVRVPVFVGHAEMINVEFAGEMDSKTARRLWMKARGITLIDLEADIEYVTPIDVQGEDSVFISRSRDDLSVENGISFWCVADNLRKGAALNAVQIAEVLVRDYF